MAVVLDTNVVSELLRPSPNPAVEGSPRRRCSSSRAKTPTCPVRFEFGDGGHNLRHGGALFADTLRWLRRSDSQDATARGKAWAPVKRTGYRRTLGGLRVMAVMATP